MTYQHPSEKAEKFSKEALKRIAKEKLDPTPEIYELWYVFYSGENPEVGRAIEILVQNKAKLSNDQCRELYNRFLSDSSQNEQVRQAGDQIQNTIRNVSGKVSDIRAATTKYSTTLSDVSEKLSTTEDKSEIEAVLKNAVSNTTAMLKYNQDLEQELIRSSQVMQELQRDLEKVRKEAMTDGLTNLSNRKSFDAEIVRVIQDANDLEAPFSLLMLDIDHFKSFNDNFGHQVGDQVLRLVARTLFEGVKGKDFVARYGGEEFAIILPETQIQGAVRVGDSLRLAVATKEVINRNTGEKLGRITLSGGVAEYKMGEKLEDIIERADSALYTAKHNGRNQVVAAPATGQKKKAS